MGGAARPLHDPGNHRSVERGSNPHTARCGSLRRPAKPAGERENDAALTPTPGARSAGHFYISYVGTSTGYFPVHKLIFVEFHETMMDAILREKRIKKWLRAWKLEMIERQNPRWRDLYDELVQWRVPP